jgi:hypothetical protein
VIAVFSRTSSAILKYTIQSDGKPNDDFVPELPSRDLYDSIDFYTRGTKRSFSSF